MHKLLLYSTLGCHLCELAKQQLEPLIALYTIELVEVDIADDDKLLERFGTSIPVIKLQEHTQELHWPFDTHNIENFLSNIIGSSS